MAKKGFGVKTHGWMPVRRRNLNQRGSVHDFQFIWNPTTEKLRQSIDGAVRITRKFTYLNDLFFATKQWHGSDSDKLVVEPSWTDFGAPAFDVYVNGDQFLGRQQARYFPGEIYVGEEMIIPGEGRPDPIYAIDVPYNEWVAIRKAYKKDVRLQTVTRQEYSRYACVIHSVRLAPLLPLPSGDELAYHECLLPMSADSKRWLNYLYANRTHYFEGPNAQERSYRSSLAKNITLPLSDVFKSNVLCWHIEYNIVYRGPGFHIET